MRGTWWIRHRLAFWINWTFPMKRRSNSRRAFICRNKAVWSLAVKTAPSSSFLQRKLSCCNYCMRNALIRVVTGWIGIFRHSIAIDFFVRSRMASASSFIWTSWTSQLLVVPLVGTSKVSSAMLRIDWNEFSCNISLLLPARLDTTNLTCSLVALISPFVYGICTVVHCCIASAYMPVKLHSYWFHQIHAAWVMRTFFNWTGAQINCNIYSHPKQPRVQKSICSVASDHSVTLLSLTERKCICLASRWVSRVNSFKDMYLTRWYLGFSGIYSRWSVLNGVHWMIFSSLAARMAQFMSGKWKPVTLIAFCMVLRVLLHDNVQRIYSLIHFPRPTGMLAEEVLSACDENSAEISPHGSTSEMGLANPAVHFFRGLRHRNLNAIRHATQRGIHQLQQLQSHNNSDNILLLKNRSSPLTIQGLRTNPKGKTSPPDSYEISLTFKSKTICRRRKPHIILWHRRIDLWTSQRRVCRNESHHFRGKSFTP